MSQPWDSEFRTQRKKKVSKRSRLRRIGRKVDLMVHAMCLAALVYAAVAAHTVKSSRH